MTRENTTAVSILPSSSDAQDLKDLKLQDSDLDQFAHYFELAFEGDTKSMTVLVALLQRLRAVETLRHQKQTGIWLEDIVCRLTYRLYARCWAGLEAANSFGCEASDAADGIFADSNADPNMVRQYHC
jgi:hypothetical protein